MPFGGVVMDGLSRLPDEIVLQILIYLPPRDLLTVTATNRRLNLLYDNSIWVRRCITDYVDWDSRHRIQDLMRKPRGEVNWKKIYTNRLKENDDAVAVLDSMLSSQHGRLDKLGSIRIYGDDIRATLQDHIDTPDTASDVLSRRWYAKSIYGHMHRTKAIQKWLDLSHGHTVSLEEALLGFDKFILCEKALHYSEISSLFEKHACLVKSRFQSWRQFTMREKALSIATYLRDESLVGLPAGSTYLDVRNSLLTTALTRTGHPSLPLISSAIYCAIASRLGINASPCSYPGHVYTVVSASEGYDLDDRISQGMPEDDNKRMFLDLFNNDLPKPAAELTAELSQLGWHGEIAAQFLAPAKTAEIVSRCARNIQKAVDATPMGVILEENLDIEPSTALYVSFWVLIILADGAPSRTFQAVFMQRSNNLPGLIDLFESHHPFDASIIQDYIVPMFDIGSQRGLLLNHLRDIFSHDLIPREVKRRTESDNHKVSYKIGQLFLHARYQYQGVIFGWDSECRMPEDWIRQMGVSTLRRGRQQPFYHIIAHDGTTRYVAEDNIRVITPLNPPSTILRKAGQYFKRWDVHSAKFISNVKDEYPDD